jgi:hypothetical protein
VRVISEKLKSVESQCQAAERASQAATASLERQLAEAKRTMEVERNQVDIFMKDAEDKFVSFARDLFRSNRNSA